MKPPLSIVERLLKDLEGVDATDPRFDDLVGRVIADVRCHVGAEEEQLFRRLEDACTTEGLHELGRMVVRAKDSAPRRRTSPRCRSRHDEPVARIDAVQNHVSAMGRESRDELAWCEVKEVPFFAHSPLRPSAAVPAPHMTAIADAGGVSLQRLQLPALLVSSPVLSVISGATQPETVLDSLAAEADSWDEDLRVAYAEDFTGRPTAVRDELGP